VLIHALNPDVIQLSDLEGLNEMEKADRVIEAMRELGLSASLRHVDICSGNKSANINAITELIVLLRSGGATEPEIIQVTEAQKQLEIDEDNTIPVQETPSDEMMQEYDPVIEWVNKHVDLIDSSLEVPRITSYGDNLRVSEQGAITALLRSP
jgi:hypothetical protein